MHMHLSLLLFQQLSQATQSAGESLMTNEAFSQISAATIAVSIIQWLKKTTILPFVNENSAWINRIVATLAAFVTSVGIHYSFDVAGGVLTVSGLIWSNILHSVWDIVKAYAVQHLIYKGIIAGPSQPIPVPIPIAQPAGS